MRFFTYFYRQNIHNVIRKIPFHHRKLVHLTPGIFLTGGILIHSLNNKDGGWNISSCIKSITAYAASEESNSRRKTSMYNFIADAVELVAPSVVFIEIKLGRDHHMTSSTGSGVIISEDGVLLTSGHVVSHVSVRDIVSVKFPDGTVLDGYVIGIDRKTDLAAVKLKNPNNIKFPAARLAKSSEVRVGEFVAALGSPLGLSNTVTSGIVSKLDRSASELKIMRSDIRYIQTDCAINVGNSGGPLINLDGEVIGINCMTVEGVSGISFAVPSDTIVEFLDKVKRANNSSSSYDVSKGKQQNTNSPKEGNYFIGVSLLTLSPDVLHSYQLKGISEGVWVGRVQSRSPAEASGLSPGDIITSVNGSRIKSVPEFLEIVKNGEPLLIEVQRNRHMHTLYVKPELVD